MASQGIPVPGTTPDWDALIRILENGQTITFYPQGSGGQGIEIHTVEELIEYMKSQGFEPIYTIRHVLSGFGQSSSADPTTSTDVVVRVGTQIVTDSVTGAVSEVLSGGHVTFAMLTRQVVTSAAMQLLVSAIQAGQVSAEVQEDLITAADPFTIDGEHVIVLIDEDGKIHYQKELLEAIRAKAVELGIFNEGEYQSTVEDTTPFAQGVIDALPLHYSVTNIHFTGRYNSGTRDGSSDYFGNITGDGPFYYGVIHHNGSYTPFMCSPNSFTCYSYTYNNSGNYSSRQTVYNTTISNKKCYYTLGSAYSDSSYDFSDNPIINLTGTTRFDQVVWIVCYGEHTGGQGVAGITPNTDTASDMRDLSKPLTQIIPQLAQGEMSTAAPTDDDIENELKWYPVNTTKENIFEEGADESDTDPDVSTDGDVSPDNKDEIEELLKDLLKHILDTANDPDSPDYDPTIPDYPTVDVQDNGDTPPAEPPLISGSANGLWKIYNPTISEIHSFGSWLWDSSIIEQITRMFSNPIDAVIALHQIYCTPVRGAAANIMCGYLDSGVQSSYTVANQYQTIDCGTVSIEEFYKTAVDYTETKIALYLPFVGIVPLDASVVMGSQLQVIYRIDVLTGTCLAQVKVIKQNSNAVMYAFNGNCACQIPLTATTYTGMVSTLVGVGTAAISAIGGSAPGVIHGAKQAIGGLVESAGTGGIKQSGTFGANAGALGIRIPYVIITHPTIYDAYAYNEQYGYPSNLTVSLGTLSGYTRVKDVHLSGIPCTDDELEMIESLLKEGVIIN